MGLIFNILNFDGETSSEYGLYITGQGVYNAPARDVEMVVIPGRNGAFPLDHGRFENLEVTYPAGIFGDDEADFADKVKAARNWLCSKQGYVRLYDSYNPSEYRLAVYKSGLDVTPAMHKAGQFDLVFECKPQRYLFAGDHYFDITSSGWWPLNDTLFPASPLLAVEGYGDITIDGRTVTIDSGPLGKVLLANGRKQTSGETRRFVYQYKLDTSKLNAGDPIYFTGYNNRISVIVPGTVSAVSNFTNIQGNAFSGADYAYNLANVNFDLSWTGSFGTASSNAASCQVAYTADGSSKSATMTVNLYLSATGYVTITVAITRDCDGFILNIPAVYGTSTQTALGQPLYIDCEIGEAYKIEDGETISVNKGVRFDSELPVLEPGYHNRIDYDSTITSLKLKRRTWVV